MIKYKRVYSAYCDKCNLYAGAWHEPLKEVKKQLIGRGWRWRKDSLLCSECWKKNERLDK